MVRASYDTLTLKLQDSLDQFERYSEQPQETAFFTQLVQFTFILNVCNRAVGRALDWGLKYSLKKVDCKIIWI